MLLSHLISNQDPLLVLLIQGRLGAGDTVRLNMPLPDNKIVLPGKDRGRAWGLLKNVKVEQFVDGAQHVIVTWKQGGTIGQTMSTMVDIETFTTKLELKRDPSQMADWVLTNVERQVTENLVDDEEPLLVTIIDQRLQAGDKVLINIEGKIPQFDGSVVTYRHVGLLTGIAELKMKSPAQRKLAGGDRGVSITFEKEGASKEKGYKGWTEVVLPPHTFDDLYTLQKVKSLGWDAWMLVNA